MFRLCSCGAATFLGVVLGVVPGGWGEAVQTCAGTPPAGDGAPAEEASNLCRQL